MNIHVTAGVRRVGNEKAALAEATFPEDRDGRALSSTDKDKIETRARGVNGNRLLATLSRVGGLQRLARGRLSDPLDSAWWRTWAMHVTNELRAAAPGVHVERHSETDVINLPFERKTVTKTRVKRITWPAPNVAVILCYGKHRLFDRLEDAPPEIVTAAALGVADGLARGRRIRFTAEDIGHALRITAAEKLAAKAWQVACCDLTPEQWAALMLERENDNQRQRRRKKNVQPREESVAAMARAAGVKPDTMRARLRRARLKAENGAEQHVANLTVRNKNETGEPSKTRQRSATADSVRTCVKTPSQNRNPPPRPSGAGGGEGFGQVEKPVAADAGEIFPERWKSRRPDHVASPTRSAALDSALASTPLAEVCR